VPTASYPVTGHHCTEKSQAPSSVFTPEYLYPWIPALSASPHMTDALIPELSLWPFAGLAPICSCLSCAGEPRAGPSVPDESQQCSVEGENQVLACCSQTQPRMVFALFAARLHCWLMVSLMSTRIPGLFLRS